MIAVIPVRGGSKGIPGKNIKEFCGKPLCHWVIEAAVESKIFEQVIVSTDSKKIAKVASLPGVTVMMRPDELAQDETSTAAVLLHVADKVNFDTVVTIQATYPFTEAYDLRAARAKFYSWGLDSMLAGVRVKHFYWDNSEGNHAVKPVNYEPLNRPRRQDFAGWIQENGAFYFTKRATLLKHKSLLGDNIGLYEMKIGIEIDDPVDWVVAEAVKKNMLGGDAIGKT